MIPSSSFFAADIWQKMVSIQWFMVALPIQFAVVILARLTVINAVAVAHVKAIFGAVAPNRVLHKPGKHGWETGVELAGVDVGRNIPNDVGAAVGPIAGGAIRVGCVEALQ